MVSLYVLGAKATVSCFPLAVLTSRLDSLTAAAGTRSDAMLLFIIGSSLIAASFLVRALLTLTGKSGHFQPEAPSATLKAQFANADSVAQSTTDAA